MRQLINLPMLLMSILLMAGGVSTATLTVDDSGGSDYARIKDAINNASNEDTILVYSGIYYENVNVNRPLILKSIDTGGGKAVIDAGKNGHAIILSAGNSTLEGFTIINASVWPNAGIYVNSNYNTIRSNNAMNNGIGIDLSYSSNNMLFGNNASNNGIGIVLSYSSNNTLKNNNASSNNYYGIDLSYSSNNTLSGNYASNNYDYDGIYLYFSSNNTLIGNYASKNNYAGIYLYSSNNTLIGNYASNNYYGIWLSGSNNNFLYQNNLISNTHNAYDTGTNQWDSGVMGNYWSDYTGTDANNDTIGDTPYPIPGGSNVDRYPLMEPWVTIPIPISTPAPSATRLTDSTSNELSPAIMKDSTGKIWLFYASDATGNYDIYYKTSSDNGITWSVEQPFAVNSLYQDGVYGISAMQDSSGKIWVAWAKDTDSDQYNWDIYYKTSTDGGNSWSSDVKFTSYYGGDMSPSVIQDKAGKIWIVWRSYGIDWGDDIWAKTSSDGGNTWSSPIAISTDSAREDIPFATVDSSGKIWVAWRKEIDLPSRNWNIYMKTSTDHGMTWSSASEMTSEAGSEDHPSLIKDSSGKVWLFWDYNPSGNWQNISYKYSMDNGASWSGISWFTFSGSNRDPRMLEDSSGQVWLVWSSNIEGNYDIWSAIISQATPAPLPDLIISDIKPIQVVWDSDINGDGKMDLVQGKATAIFVYVEGFEGLSDDITIDINLNFEGTAYTESKTVRELKQDNRVIFYVTPELIGDQIIVAEVKPSDKIPESDETNNTKEINITIKDTNGLYIGYIPLYAHELLPLGSNPPLGYGPLNLTNYSNSVENNGKFIYGTYPVAEKEIVNLEEPLLPFISFGNPVPYFGVYDDALDLWIAGELLTSTRADKIVGVAPPNYFEFHGRGATGLYLGYGAVLIEEEDWTAAAHEIGHSYGLRLDVEEYDYNYFHGTPGYRDSPPWGFISEGYWVNERKEIQNGVSFMGNPATLYSLTDIDTNIPAWICNDCYEDLFRNFSIKNQNSNVVIVSGKAYKNGTIELKPFYWIDDGISDNPLLGNYSFRLLDFNKNIISNISFDMPFIEYSDSTGISETNVSGFAFVASYPKNTSYIQILRQDKNLVELNINAKLLHDAVNSIPNVGFIKNSEQRRNTLHNKIDAVEKMLEENNTKGATEKLQHDVRDKLVNWLVDYEVENPLQLTKNQVIGLVDEIIYRLNLQI